MIEFLLKNWDSVLFIAAIIVAFVYLALRGKKEIIAKILYTLVTEAEQLYGSGTGQTKLAYVVEKAYSFLPAIVKLFITYQALEKLIETALQKAKTTWLKENVVTPLSAAEKPDTQ